MPFPSANRVIFKRNPLKEVICQLRFPPILKIDSEIPANFQDLIRNEFPKYKETGEQREIPIPNPDELEPKRNIEQGTRNIELRNPRSCEYFDIPCSIFVIQNHFLPEKTRKSELMY